MLLLARGVFPPLPTIVEVLSEDGGWFALRIAGRENELLLAVGPRDQIRDELRLLGRIIVPTRGRYEIEFEVAEIFWLGRRGDRAPAGHRRTITKMRRASPRVAVNDAPTPGALLRALSPTAGSR